MRIIRIGAILGAVVGSAIAVIMVTLVLLRPLPAPVEWFFERMVFILCPPLILGFTSFVNGTTSLYLVVVTGNALLYGAVFGAVSAVIALGVTLFKKHTAQAP